MATQGAYTGSLAQQDVRIGVWFCMNELCIILSGYHQYMKSRPYPQNHFFNKACNLTLTATLGITMHIVKLCVSVNVNKNTAVQDDTSVTRI